MKKCVYLLLIWQIPVYLTGTAPVSSNKPSQGLMAGGLSSGNRILNSQIPPHRSCSNFQPMDGFGKFPKKFDEPSYTNEIKESEAFIKQLEEEIKKVELVDDQAAKKLTTLLILLKKNLLDQKENKERLKRAYQMIESGSSSMPLPKYKQTPLICQRMSYELANRRNRWLLAVGVFEEEAFYRSHLEKEKQRNKNSIDKLGGTKRADIYTNNPSCFNSVMIWDLVLVGSKIVQSVTRWRALTTEETKQVCFSPGNAPLFSKRDYRCSNCHTQFSGYFNSEVCHMCHTRSKKLYKWRRMSPPNKWRQTEPDAIYPLTYRTRTTLSSGDLADSGLITGCFFIIHTDQKKKRKQLFSFQKGEFVSELLNQSLLRKEINGGYLFNLFVGRTTCKFISAGDLKKTMTYAKKGLSFRHAVSQGYEKEYLQSFYVKRLKETEHNNKQSDSILPPYNKLFIKHTNFNEIDGFFQFFLISKGSLSRPFKRGVTFEKLRLDRLFIENNPV